MFSRKLNASKRFSLALGILAALGVWILKISTPNGMGLTDDAISYIAAARALLNGEGFTRIWLASGLKPITHWPPLFSATIALAGVLTRRDPARAARLVNALLFGGNTFALGILGWKMTRRYLGGVLLAALFLSNAALLLRHAYALSEPLYIFFTLLAFLALASALREDAPHRTRDILAAGLLSGLAYLTRYAALSLLATVSLILLLLPKTWKERFSLLLLYWAGTLPLALGWSLRNEIVGGNATNRALRWHPVDAATLREGAFTLWRFLFPFQNSHRFLVHHPIAGYLLLGALAAALILWTARESFRAFFAERPNLLAYGTAAYLLVYVGALLVSISLFDAATPLNERILSPVFVSLLILLVYAGMPAPNAAETPRNGLRAALRASLPIILFLALAVSSINQVRAIRSLQESAPGFASWRWKNSDIMATLRTLPEGAVVYTNQPPAVYFWTGRPAFSLPLYSGDEAAAKKINAEAREGNALIVLWESTQFSPQALQFIKTLTEGLPVAQKTGLGVIYGTLP